VPLKFAPTSYAAYFLSYLPLRAAIDATLYDSTVVRHTPLLLRALRDMIMPPLVAERGEPRRLHASDAAFCADIFQFCRLLSPALRASIRPCHIFILRLSPLLLLLPPLPTFLPSPYITRAHIAADGADAVERAAAIALMLMLLKIAIARCAALYAILFMDAPARCCAMLAPLLLKDMTRRTYATADDYAAASHAASFR